MAINQNRAAEFRKQMCELVSRGALTPISVWEAAQDDDQIELKKLKIRSLLMSMPDAIYETKAHNDRRINNVLQMIGVYGTRKQYLCDISREQFDRAMELWGDIERYSSTPRGYPWWTE